MKLRALMHRGKHPHFVAVTFGLVEIASGAARVLTLGRRQPNWCVKYIGWQMRQEIAEQQADEGRGLR